MHIRLVHSNNLNLHGTPDRNRIKAAARRVIYRTVIARECRARGKRSLVLASSKRRKGTATGRYLTMDALRQHADRLIEEATKLVGSKTPTRPEVWAKSLKTASNKFPGHPPEFINWLASEYYKHSGGDWK